jgi:chorismate lyase/3-hydroxybenzoate synthase
MNTQMQAEPGSPTDESANSDGSKPLAISVGEGIVAPSAEHNLLLGFDFGGNAGEHIHDAVVKLRLPPLDRQRVIESWWYRGDVRYSKSGDVRLAECHDYTAAIVWQDTVAAGDFREQTRQSYERLINAVRTTNHTKLVRIWNYFDDINDGDDDEEKYRRFCVGRAEAFEALGIHDESAPTGTAIGTCDSNGLALIAIASNRDFQPVENPRQTSAYLYPRQYGPRSPKFSRGGLLSLDSHDLFLISGTAAVVGHESNYPYDTVLQAEETFRNLALLCDEAVRLRPGKPQFFLDRNSVLRVYLKNPEDYHDVREKLGAILKGSDDRVIYLHGVICRRELMIEIEGVNVA